MRIIKGIRWGDEENSEWYISHWEINRLAWVGKT